MMPHHNLLLLLTVVALTCGTSFVIAYPHGLDSTVRFCSSSLADTLQLVCRSRGGLNGPGDAAPLGVPSFTGGVARECCAQPCSWRTILSYCVNSSIEEMTPPEETTTLGPQQDESQFDNRLIEMLFGPAQVPKRRSRKSGCPKKCDCKRARKPDRNRLANNLNVGTVPPDLIRPPVVVRNL